jgi:hypothetical protein
MPKKCPGRLLPSKISPTGPGSIGEEIDNLGDVRFKISDLKFNHDPEFIIAYQCLGRFYDRNLNEYIDDDDDDE